MALPWASPNTLKRLLEAPAKRIVVSGPSGFLGSRVVHGLLQAMSARREAGLEPGKIVLLSSSPGRLMEHLSKKYSTAEMDCLRASRVNYYSQHSVDTWTDQLGAMGCGGPDSVFVNLAALAGPVIDHPNAMMKVNYYGAHAAANACKALEFGHFIQSSTQATAAERAGQVPYSKHKSMTDFSLGRIEKMPVTIASLGLLYCKADAVVGQDRDAWRRQRDVKLNLIDLSLLPLTPIMGNGRAPMQPQEVLDAAHRLCFLGLTEPSLRPRPTSHPKGGLPDMLQQRKPELRFYDAVGPEMISILELLKRFARYQGKEDFRPVFIDYRRMEEVLNVRSLGNLNRQFVSLLRSEQHEGGKSAAHVGCHAAWDEILEGTPLLTLDEAFSYQRRRVGTLNPDRDVKRRRYPYLDTLRFVSQNPRVVVPGLHLAAEVVHSFLNGCGPDELKVDEPRLLHPTS